MAKKAPLNPDTYPYPECREQHQWQPYDGAIDKGAKLAYRTQKCGNCPTKRYSVLSMRAADYGDTIRSHYVYPKDYLVPGGMSPGDRGRIKMHNFFAELGTI